MLSKNLLSVVAVLLCAQASVLFGNVDEKSLTKKAARAAATANALKTQFDGEIEIIEEEIDEEIDEKEKDEVE